MSPLAAAQIWLHPAMWLNPVMWMNPWLPWWQLRDDQAKRDAN